MRYVLTMFQMIVRAKFILFSLTVLFVLITIVVSIFALNYYDKSLVEVDFLHGSAEFFLTLSDFIILIGFIKMLNNIDIKNS